MAKEETAKLEKAASKPADDRQPEQQQEAGWIHPSRLGFVPHENQTQEQRDEAAAQLKSQEKTWDGSGGKFRGKGGRGRGGGGGRGGGRGKFSRGGRR